MVLFFLFKYDLISASDDLKSFLAGARDGSSRLIKISIIDGELWMVSLA